MYCELCNNKLYEYKYITKKSERIYYHCNACNLLILGPSYYTDYESELKRYNYHNNNLSNISYVNYLRDIINKTIDYIDFHKISAILDYGCGSNPILLKILEKYYDKPINLLFFFDLFFYPYIRSLDITLDINTKFIRNKFDLIFCIEVVEHFDKIINNFDNIIKYLNQNGYLVIVTNFFNKNYLTNLSEWWYLSDITHKTIYSFKTFDVIIHRYNFEIIYTNMSNIIILKKL